jgi:hypothetical protein
MGSLTEDPILPTANGIPLMGLGAVNPMLMRLAQREGESDLLTLLRAARSAGMEITVTGRRSADAEPPRPDVPFSVIWFDDDMPAYGRIGVGMVGASHGLGRPAPVNVLTEESWVSRRAETVEDPHELPELMRWEADRGWMNDHVVFLTEARPYPFLINWTVTGLRSR